MAGIYLHIPFCKQACHYCDFHFSTNLQDVADMVECIGHELLLQKNYTAKEIIQTIYFGGGTPSVLSEQQIAFLLNSIYQHYDVSPDAEVTIEANPDDLTEEKLRYLKSLGINRLSLGTQSFNDEILQFLNRPHTAAQAQETVEEVGFSNISIDLIYAIPGQSVSQWEHNIEKAISLNVQHISSYALSIEPKTVFGNWYQKGKLIPVHDDNAVEQMDVLIDKLTAAGFDHYEVSNFARPGFHSRHNSSYWKQQVYLGVGPGAHSYNLTTRQFNVKNNAGYIRALRRNQIPFEQEVLTREDHVNEYLLTTLRTSWGADMKFIEQHYAYNLMQERLPFIESLLCNNLAVIENHHLKLTRAGRLVADKVSSDLFLEPNTT